MTTMFWKGRWGLILCDTFLQKKKYMKQREEGLVLKILFFEWRHLWTAPCSFCLQICRISYKLADKIDKFVTKWPRSVSINYSLNFSIVSCWMFNSLMHCALYSSVLAATTIITAEITRINFILRHFECSIRNKSTN